MESNTQLTFHPLQNGLYTNTLLMYYVQVFPLPPSHRGVQDLYHPTK